MNCFIRIMRSAERCSTLISFFFHVINYVYEDSYPILSIMIEAVVIEVGNVRLIVVSGGDIPHIGAISFGNRSEENNRALGTHKELALTQKLFTRLKEVYSANLLITGGIHIDKISRKQVMESCDLLTDGIAKIIK